MPPTPPWSPGESPEERQARREAYARLAAAARRAGLPIQRLHDLLGQVARNESETRAFLRDEVYGVPDSILDDLLRLRMSDLEEREGEGEGAEGS
jgi:hypothetical protein